MCAAPVVINPAFPNILYVDDEVNNLVTFTAAFRKYFNVYTANSAREGLEVLRSAAIQLIVTDQRMPEMTGVQFLEAVIPEHPDAVRMVLTGFSDVEAIIRAINSGRVFRYITKPWDPDELKQVLDTAVKMYNLEKANRELVTKLQVELGNQKRVVSLFQKYVPADVVNDIINSQDEITYTRGENRIVSVLFSDIRNFTQLSAKLAPEVVVEYLNHYFSIMTECVTANKGTVNKFLGDGLLALFGAPLSYIDNPFNAVACGMDMLKKLKVFNEKYSDLVGQKISIGIGVNTGEVIVGTVGSSERIEYTAIGRTVNIASRIEELTREYLDTLLISESTYLPIEGRVETEMLTFSIRGEEGVSKIYKVNSFT
jgi:adenylate cyclase